MFLLFSSVVACPQIEGDICSARGSCNDTISGNGQCSCSGNYGGTACETCVDDKFGMDCSQSESSAIWWTM